MSRVHWSRRKRIMRARAALSVLRGGSVVYGVRISARPGEPLLSLPNDARHSTIAHVQMVGGPSSVGMFFPSMEA